jgi:DNA-binding NarL/FixJ family response regulator
MAADGDVDIAPEVRNWSPREDRVLWLLATSGASLSEIAVKLDRSRRAIRDRFGKLGL